MNDSLKTLLIVAFLLVILWNLGAGLYYMLVDKGQTKRTVNALTKRIALSVVLILLVVLAIWMGCITPPGIQGSTRVARGCLLLPLQGEGRDGDGVCRRVMENHPHPCPPLEG